MVSRAARRIYMFGIGANGAVLPVDGLAWRLPCPVGRAFYLRPKSRRCAAVGHLRAKSRALRPGCAPKRRCGASPKRACGRSARRKRYHIATAWVVCCESWPVGAACMRPAAVCPMVPFFGRDRVRSMRRGGIDAARKHCGHCPLPGRLLFVLPCRAGVHARRTL